MRIHGLLAPLGATLLAACAATPAEPIPAPGMTGKCDTAPVKAYVGQVATDAVVAKAKAASGADIARVLRPGDIVTMEYRADRLNIMVDEKRVITSMSCS